MEIYKKQTLISARGAIYKTTDAHRAARPNAQVQVLQLLIRDGGGRTLVELRQTFPDGRVRERNVALSEKLMAGEDWRDAAGRAVRAGVRGGLSTSAAVRGGRSS